MRYAIWVDYVTDQNCPSKPEMIRVPGDRQELESFLADLWCQVFHPDRDEPPELQVGDDMGDYCDLYITDGENYVLLTYVEREPEGEEMQTEHTITDATTGEKRECIVEFDAHGVTLRLDDRIVGVVDLDNNQLRYFATNADGEAIRDDPDQMIYLG